MHLTRSIKLFFFPVCCAVCGKWGEYVCSSCFNKLPKAEFQKCIECGRLSAYGLTHPGCRRSSSLTGSVSMFFYSGNVKKIIKKIKYLGEYEIVYSLFSYLSPFILKESFKYFHVDRDNSVLIPVPLYPLRKLQRGFNQSEIIAQNISKITGIKYYADVLIRTKNTEAQAKIKKRLDREKNVKNAFRCGIIQNNLKSVIIIDDVYSSGATLRSCARAIIKSNQHVSVYAWTFAQGK